MNKKLLIMILPVVLLVTGAGAYKFMFAAKEEEPKPKVEGTVYVLGREFLVSLATGALRS